MKFFYAFVLSFLLSTSAIAAGSDSSSSDSSSLSMYDEGVKLIKRASKLEKKEKADKAKKLYSQAFKKFEKAYLKDKKNPDILNYLGYSSRKSGNFTDAEQFYLKGLSINPKHKGINYLELHFFEQYLTFSQFNFHFFLQVKGLLQT